MKIRYVTAILLLILTPGVNAISVGNFPGLPKLIDVADAIVILRVERPLSDYDSPTSYTTYKCFIYQTLKGDIPKESYINLQLFDLEGFTSSYPHLSTHLIFLIKRATENEPTEYRMLTDFGAQTLLSPFGHEKMPEGDTIEEQVTDLIKEAIDYHTREYEKRVEFLKSMIGESGDSGHSPDNKK